MNDRGDQTISKWKPRIIFSGKLSSWAIFGLFVAYTPSVSAADDLGGFVLGGSFEAARQHALEHGWKLVPLSENLPGQWIVEGANLTLFVCHETVSSITERLDGDLEEFAALVFSMQIEFGKPDIQALSLPSGIGVISTIDARFDTENGGATVQLQSIDGQRTFSVSHRLETECR